MFSEIARKISRKKFSLSVKSFRGHSRRFGRPNAAAAAAAAVVNSATQQNMEDSRRAAHAAAAAEEEEAAERAIPSAAAAPATPAVADPAAVGAGTGVPTGVPTAATLADLEAERALHHRRAERFGGEYVDPVSYVFCLLHE